MTNKSTYGGSIESEYLEVYIVINFKYYKPRPIYINKTW